MVVEALFNLLTEHPEPQTLVVAVVVVGIVKAQQYFMLVEPVALVCFS
jgi:hypothetical protein